MATNNMNMDGMMLFEQPFARVSSVYPISLVLTSVGALRELPQGIPHISEEH